MRKVALFIFSMFFLAETLVNRGVELTPFQWVMLAFAASMAGRASAYLSVLEWFRWPFTKTVPHSSGAGADNHPRYESGVMSAIGELVCCPVCAGTWAATIMLTVFKFDPAWGEAILITLSAASLAWLVSFTTQMIEWHTHMSREYVGLINRQNRRESLVERAEMRKTLRMHLEEWAVDPDGRPLSDADGNGRVHIPLHR